MANLTEMEQKVLVASMNFWNYGDETEKEDNAVMFNLKELSDKTGLKINTLKGVVGSLFKKNLFCEMEGGETGNLIEIGITDEGIDVTLLVAGA